MSETDATTATSPTLKFTSRNTPGDGMNYGLTIHEACIFHLPGVFGDLALLTSYATLVDDARAAACIISRVGRIAELKMATDSTTSMFAFSNIRKKIPSGPRLSFDLTITRPRYILVDKLCDAASIGLFVRCDVMVKFVTSDPERYIYNLSLG
jgi:hypothetical protein